ncbi:hypothetical protein C2S53_017918 [Perilla frutescens var. hirtella]|uniref:Uncharacterized protein n=1 Tax=Perilla frutescens var. hirtella TaxID=608512 RepID=A0AAD4J1E5_PERFH|nr:hypothetical protein C2S51_020903 [Perilla frutescens var. frutescens]KAH6824970.1 hypothetical protein C2S53_017918 [Perilla frutescens var. hirtella]
MVPHAINQNDTFYVAPWTRHREGLVLSLLQVEKRKHKWVPGEHNANKKCLSKVRAIMKKYHDVDIPLEAYLAKVREWNTRYSAFNWLLSQTNVQYHERLNYVNTSRARWTDLLLDNEFVQHYMNEGEVNWEMLRDLFRVVINLASDSTSFHVPMPENSSDNSSDDGGGNHRCEPPSYYASAAPDTGGSQTGESSYA